MPGRNGKGPMGMGPGSGRGFGQCRGRGFGASGYTRTGATGESDQRLNRFSDAIDFRQAGLGRGFRHMFRATGLPGWLRVNDASMVDQNRALVEDKEQLAKQLEAMQTELESISRRLSEMERADKA